MSKYIVDIDDFEPMFKVDSIGVFGIGKSVTGNTEYHSWSRIKSLVDFEELNSDYINEHFGDLQDTAYKKGLHDGESKCGYCNEYQRGLDDAWECARKIADMWTRIDNDELLAIFGITERIGHSAIKSLFGKQTANEAMLELEAYEEKQKAEDDIKVGDEVISTYSDGSIMTSVRPWVVSAVVRRDGENPYYKGIDYTGDSHGNACVLKTGKHFDIAGLLEEMRA